MIGNLMKLIFSFPEIQHNHKKSQLIHSLMLNISFRLIFAVI